MPEDIRIDNVSRVEELSEILQDLIDMYDTEAFNDLDSDEYAAIEDLVVRGKELLDTPEYSEDDEELDQQLGLVFVAKEE